MCISCGCRRYEESHGDERNITIATLENAAAANNQTLKGVLKAMNSGCSDLLHGEIPSHRSNGQAVIERLHPD